MSDLKITNDMQIVLVKFLNPQIRGKKQFSEALELFVVDGYARIFRQIIDHDTLDNPNNRLIDIWNRNRAKDPDRIIPLIAYLLSQACLEKNMKEEQAREA